MKRIAYTITPYTTVIRLLGVVQNPANGFPARPLATINAAEEAGLITEQQADHVLVADIIIRARRTDDKRYVHAVFEVSRTIRLDDITRAHGRAATVASATGEPTIAAVVGELIQPPQQQQADEMGVKVLLPPLLQQGQAGDETAAPIC